MASKFICDCGETLRTNLFEGHNLKILVSETTVERADSVDEIVVQSQIVVDCKRCNSRYFVDNDYNIEKFEKR